MKIHTPIGFLWLDADESGLTAVSFQPISESESANQRILTRTQEQFEEYFGSIISRTDRKSFYRSLLSMKKQNIQKLR